MVEDSSEFVSNEQQTSDERVELYRSQYFIVSKIRLFGKWRIEKRLTPEYEFQPLQRTSLEREFEIGYQLEHPNIVRYLELRKTEQGVPYIIMEYVDGMNLQEYMQSDENCTKKDFSAIFISLVSALSYLQQRQIYHLDIKPENIVVTYKEHIPKLIDFGVSNSDTYQTSLGATKQYSTDEHIDYSKVSSKTDMYSFAKTMNEFANNKHIALSRKEKCILHLCTQPHSQKRLDANGALQIMKRNGSNKSILVVAIILFLLSILGLFLVKDSQKTDNTSIPIKEVKIEPEDTNTIVPKYSSDTVQVLPSQKTKENTKTNSKQKSKIQEVHNEKTKQEKDTIEKLYVNPKQKLTTKEELNEIISKATNTIPDRYSRDSLFFEDIARQKVSQYKEFIQSNTQIDKYEFKLQLSNEFQHTSDSVIKIYMKANKFGMVSGLETIKYQLLEKIEHQMDSLREAYKN